MSQLEWRLIAPAEDAASARPIAESLLPELERIAKALGLRYTRDEASRKVYLGLPASKASEPAQNALVYPSGSTAARHKSNNDPRYAPARPDKAAPLVATEPDIQVSKHFRLGEFRPKSSAYDGVRVHPKLVDVLERIRAAAGGTIHITSGYRPPAYNDHVGGEVNSFHLDGTAADIYCDNLTTSQLHAVCEKIVGDAGGLGYYPSGGFCHVDVRGYRARWTG